MSSVLSFPLMGAEALEALRLVGCVTVDEEDIPKLPMQKERGLDIENVDSRNEEGFEYGV